MLRIRIEKKLKSNRGTSIFFGLLLFMVASILSAVMLSASVTTVKRVESDKKVEQNYLTCSSAAKLLRDEIVNTSITYYRSTVIRVQGTGGMVQQDTPEAERWKSNPKNTSISTEFAPSLQDYVQTFAERSSVSSNTLKRTYNISVPTAEGTELRQTFVPVTANCIIQEAKSGNGYDITIKLSTGATADDCQIVVYLTGAVNEKFDTINDPNKGTTTTTVNKTYTWTATDFIYGDQERTSEAGT